jgi:hypothetical protein
MTSNTPDEEQKVKTKTKTPVQKLNTPDEK